MITLEELKGNVAKRFSQLEQERINAVMEYEIPNVGTIKLAPPLPDDAHKLMIEAAPMFQKEDEVAAQAALSWISNETYIKLLVMTCVYEPKLDNEAYEALIKVLDTSSRLDLINKCAELSTAIGAEVEENTVKVENFIGEIPGPSSE